MTNTPTFIAEVRDLSSDGYGVANHPDGLVIFIPGSWPGDTIEAKVLHIEKRRYGMGQLIKIIHPSPERITSICPHLGNEKGQCSGCSWLIATYEAQLKWKTHRLKRNFIKSKLFENEEQTRKVLKDIVAAKQVIGYRNRAQFKTDGEQIGYVSAGTSHIAPIQNCIILNSKMQTVLKDLQTQLPKHEWKPQKNKPWNFLDIDDDCIENEVIPLNQRRPFKQGHTEQNEVMKLWLSNSISKLNKNTTVIELFAGSGNFTKILLQAGFTHTVAAEVIAPAIEQLRTLKALGSLTSVTTDLFNFDALKKIGNQHPDAELLVLDPPRDGSIGIQFLVEKLPKLRTIIYISCNQSTFIRDAIQICKRGFQIEEITPIDLFPQTPHLEIMSVFTRQLRDH